VAGPTAYARRGDSAIAYRVLGDAPIDLLFIGGMISHVEVMLEEPGLARWFERMSEFARVILMDRRGTGLSDPLPEGEWSFEDEAEDVTAVLDAVGSAHCAINGYTTGAQLAIHFAAAHPERCRALILYAPMGRTLADEDYDWALTHEQRRETLERMFSEWGTGFNAEVFAPNAVGDSRVREWLGRLERMSMSPGALLRMIARLNGGDVRHLLGGLDVPTLILHRTDDTLIDVRHSRYLAERIPGARLVEQPGADNLPSIGDPGALLGEMEEFLTGGRRHGVQRAILTVLFTDIVNGTGHAARLGDGPWRDLLAAHERAVRAALARFEGREIKTVGDGFLVAFDGPPSAALRCARAVVESVQSLGLELRAGLHTGECEILGDDVAGMAVHIAARVAALAEPGEILASGTAYGTVVGSGLSFTYRGERELRGVPGRWPLFALDHQERASSTPTSASPA
jgi:class 3 adenylate cyclase